MSEEPQNTCPELLELLGHVERAKHEWEHAVDCIDGMVLLADGEGAVKRCNKPVVTFLGKPYSEIIGGQWRDLLAARGLDTSVITKDERYAELFNPITSRWFQANLYSDKFAEKDLSEGIVVTITDITESKMLAESLEITNKVIDRDRNELQFALDEISFLLREVERERDLGLRFRVPDTSTSGPICQIAGHFNDMMDKLEFQHKQLEKTYSDLKDAQSRILQQEKMASIGQLAAGIAHEINNPMGFIISNLGSLQKFTGKLIELIDVQADALEKISASPADGAAILDNVGERKKSLKIDYIRDDLGNLLRESLEGADRVKNIVQDLKRFSRIDESEYAPADINSGIESTIHIVWNEIKYKATLSKEYGDLPATKCNLGQLNQVFMNILVNAAHAIEKQGEIAIRTWYENGYIHVAISDTGRGIPQDKIGRIFEPFYTTKDVGKGTGLGLSIAYDIVKKHNGEILVESEVGKGTTFTIKIPVEE